MIRVFVAVYYLHLIWRIIISGWPWDTMKIYAEQLPSFSCVIKTNHPFFLLTYSEMHFVLFIKLVNKDYRSQLREVSEALHPLGTIYSYE
jgi:general transcription factor 3C polypeptide 1